MKYEIRYTNPTHIHLCDHVETYRSITQVRTFIRQARQYPGSYNVEAIEKITAKGVRTYIPMSTIR